MEWFDKRYIPFDVSPGDMTTLRGRLSDEGVETPQDLSVLHIQDIPSLPFLNKVKVRKLLQCWASLSEPQTEAPPRTPPPQTPPHRSESLPPPAALAFSPASSPGGPRDGWEKEIEFTWLISTGLLAKLQSGERPAMSKEWNDLVRCAIDQVHQVCSKPRKRHLDTIATRICAQFPGLKDQVLGEPIGAGHYTLFRKLLARSENVRRTSSAQDAQKTLSTQTVQMDQKRRKDSYGCIAYAPTIINEEELETRRVALSLHGTSGSLDELCELFPLQRQHILQTPNINRLVEDWPLLFTERGLCEHFKLFTGVPDDKFQTSYVTKAPQLLQFLMETSKDIQFNRDVSQQPDGKTRTGRAMIHLLAGRFAEKQQLVVDEPSTCTSQTFAAPQTPVVVSCGVTMWEPERFMLAVDGIVILERIPSLTVALRCLFHTFFVLNIEYPAESCASLDFIQRIFFGIQPDTGSKQGNKKRHNVHPKVLKLTNEWARHNIFN